MSKNGTAGQKLRDMRIPENYQDPANLNDLKINENLKLQPELCSLLAMDDLIRAYRHDFLKNRKDYKELRKQHSSHKLTEIHLQHRLDTLEAYARSCAQSYSALRTDMNVHRACIIKNVMSQHTD